MTTQPTRPDPHAPRVRTHTWQPPVPWAGAAGVSGAALLRKILDGDHVGRTTATAEARVVGSVGGKLHAHATTTCAVFAAPRPEGAAS
ncbi:hypothetical protein ACIG3E_19980 [Streptomyces sp. NPDC053474]|uniref:hypothetical protein n=1 Tax=Streptomyces sp. NPDC053474 TaxID=3365704 RepID=UPI0037D69B0A